MSSEPGRAVALLSGGLDSVVATTAAARSGGVLLALTFDYGQRSAKREAEAARRAARALGVRWKAVALPWLGRLAPETVSAGKGLPAPSREELASGTGAADRARAVWVPNRNGVFVNVAAAFAEAARAGAVVAGFNREEARAFPDNSREFMRRASSALGLSTLAGVRVESPTARLDKRGIVRLGLSLEAPLDHVWSCYRGGARMCGRCEGCARLVGALRDCGAPLESWPRGARHLFSK